MMVSQKLSKVQSTSSTGGNQKVKLKIFHSSKKKIGGYFE